MKLKQIHRWHYCGVQTSLRNIWLVEDDRNLRQVIDAEGWGKSVGVAEDDAEGALLLDDFDAQKVGQSLRIADVDVERTDVADTEPAWPVAVFDIQQPDAEQLILIESGPVER